MLPNSIIWMDTPRVHPQFTNLWKSVNTVCLRALELLDERPTADLQSTYISLIEDLSRNLTNVYTITAFKCSDVPTLVRGSTTNPVVGDRDESTQVLVVYYLLRELLKKQLQNGHLIDYGDDVIPQYLDSFEKFTSGVHLIKGCFTYLHWAWQKRGLPTEHTLLKTETVANHLWCEQKLDLSLRDALRKRAQEIVSIVRNADRLNIAVIPLMENVKRLSLNLLILNDGRQLLYSSLVEDPYLANLSEHYNNKKALFKRTTRQDYIHTVLSELKKEELRATFFLAKCSYDKVKQRYIDVLIGSEKEYLSEGARVWLQGDKGVDSILRYKNALRELYELLGNGSQATWLEKHVRDHVKDQIENSFEAGTYETEEDVVLGYIRVLKETYHIYSTALTKLFGNNDERLIKAVSSGCASARPRNEAHLALVEASLASALPRFAVAEITTEDNDMLDTKRNWVVEIYKIIDKKEEFCKVYLYLLRDRLLKWPFTGIIFSKEQNMALALFIPKEHYDFTFTCKQMIRDACVTSPNVADLASFPVSFKVQPLILRRSAWKHLFFLQQEQSVILPPQLHECVDICKNTYLSNFPGRTIEFLPLYSTVVVRFNKQARFRVSVHQLPIILAFNKKPMWSVDELSSRTCISPARCIKILDIALAAGLLRREGTTYCAASSQITLQDKNLYNFPYHDTDPVEEIEHATHSDVSIVEPQTLQANIVSFIKKASSANLESIVIHLSSTLNKVKDADFVTEVKHALETLISRDFVTRTGRDFAYVP